MLQGTSLGVWIGYHYATYHTQWVWADNSEPRYFNWATGQPGDIVSLTDITWYHCSD